MAESTNNYAMPVAFVETCLETPVTASMTTATGWPMKAPPAPTALAVMKVNAVIPARTTSAAGVDAVMTVGVSTCVKMSGARLEKSAMLACVFPVARTPPALKAIFV